MGDRYETYLRKIAGEDVDISNMPEPSDRYEYYLRLIALKGGGGGGGGGAVDDVQINGTSIVDGEGVADIESDDLDFVTPVSGSTPTITAVAGMRYVCGEVSTIDFTPSVTGVCDVVFTSGSTPAVLTMPNTVKFPSWFDPTSLDANTTYEINILNGTLGAVMAWA